MKNRLRLLILAVLLACLPFIYSCKPTYTQDDITVPPVLDEVRQRNVKWFFGDTERFERMFRTGEISFDLLPPYGGNILHYAAFTGSIPRVKYLLKLHPDVYVRMKRIYFPSYIQPCMGVLQCAVASGNVELVKLLMYDEDIAEELKKTGQRLNIEELDGNRRTLSFYSGSLDVAKWFRCEKCVYLLPYIATFGDTELFKWAYSAIDQDEYYYRDVWENILRCGNVELAQWLLEYGQFLEKSGFVHNDNTDIGGRYSRIGISEFLKTHDKLLLFAAQSGNLDMVKWMEKQEAKIDPASKNSFSILYAAAQSGNLDMVKWLVNKGFNVKASDSNCNTILHGAAESGNLEMVKWLIEQGADINAKNNYNETILHAAAKSGNLELIKWIIEQGLSVKDGVNTSYCCFHYNKKVLDYLAENGNLEALKWIQAQGFDIKESSTILFSAAQSGNLELVKWLVEQNVHKINIALHEAARRGAFDVVKWLSEQEGFDVHARDSNGSTVLHMAARTSHLPMVKWLVEQGLDVNAQDDELYSVLNVAHEDSEVYRWLKEQSALLNE